MFILESGRIADVSKGAVYLMIPFGLASPSLVAYAITSRDRLSTVDKSGYKLKERSMTSAVGSEK